VTPLPRSAGSDTAPAFSPDGRSIAFNSDRAGPHDLYVLELERRTVARVTTKLAVRAQPSWSRDGRRILFSAGATGVEEVYVVNADGTGLTRLTRGTEGTR
jgi:TolB protein